jgi:hypothetical protein
VRRRTKTSAGHVTVERYPRGDVRVLVIVFEDKEGHVQHTYFGAEETGGELVEALVEIGGIPADEAHRVADEVTR